MSDHALAGRERALGGSVSPRSVVAAQARAAVLIAVAMRLEVVVAVPAIGTDITRIVRVNVPAAHGIGRKRREGARSGEGRPLIDVVVLRHPFDGVILQLRGGHPLKTPADMVIPIRIIAV